MAAYLVVEARVNDAAAYERYEALAQTAIATYGGRYLVRSGPVETIEGDWTPPERLVIVEFDSVEQAKQFYDSPEYRAARIARENAASMNMLVVGGV